MNRKDYIIKCITSSAFLVRGCNNQEQINSILNRTNDMLNRSWKVEYKSYDNSCKICLSLKIKEFWNNIWSQILKNISYVYRFDIIYGESVNPPGQEGNVNLFIQPENSVIQLRFTLNPSKTFLD